MKTQAVVEIIGLGAKKYGGLEKFIVEECRQLKARGIRLVIIFNAEPLCRDYICDLEAAGGDWYVIPSKQLGFFAYLNVLNKLFRKYSLKAVHSNFGGGREYIIERIASLLNGCRRHILTEHCCPDLSGLRQKMAYTLLALMFSAILCVSKATAEIVRNGIFCGRRKVVAGYLGVPDLVFDKKRMLAKYALPENRIRIANVAYHNPVKGVDVLLRAVSLLKEKNAGFQIIQIGGGQNPEQTEVLRDLEDSLGIADCVTWLGISDAVPEILSACDIYVQPSRSEGLCLAVMEASVAALPCVGSDVGGIKEAILDGKTGYLVPPENPAALAEALQRLIKHPENRYEMGRRAREHVLEQFSLSKNAMRLIEKGLLH